MYKHQSTTISAFQEDFMRVIDCLNEKNKHFVIGGYINTSMLKCDQCIVD